MSLQNRPALRPNRPMAVEFGIVTAALIAVYLWHRVVRVASEHLSTVLGPVAPPGTLAVLGLVTGGLFVSGLVLFAGAYANLRDTRVGLALPRRPDRSLVGLAVAAPLVLVGVTKLVGVLTGVPYGSLTNTYYGTDPTALPVLTVVGLGVLVGVPSLVLVCQVLVQGSFERVVGGDSAVVLTTLVSGFAMTSHSGLATAPDEGKLAGSVLFVLALGVALYATEHGTRERLRHLAYLPVVLFVALVVLSWVTQTESIAEGLFAIAQLAVLGVAAYTYDRSGSLFVPALAYLSVSLAGSAVVLVLEAGGVSPV